MAKIPHFHGSKCSNIHIAPWLYLNKALSLRLTLLLCPEGFRERPWLPCVCGR